MNTRTSKSGSKVVDAKSHRSRSSVKNIDPKTCMVNALYPSTVQAELIDFGISWWRWGLFGSIEQGGDAGTRAAGWVADSKYL